MELAERDRATVLAPHTALLLFFDQEKDDREMNKLDHSHIVYEIKH